MRNSRFRGSHHAAAAAAAVRAGRSFEDDLDATNRSYADAGLGTIARAHPPVGGPPRALYYKGKGDVDFVGHILGVPTAFDAKSEAGAASYKHDADWMHQIDFLLNWRATGGVAFILLRDLERDVIYLIADLATLRAGGSVPLRTHARGRSLPIPIVPALHRTESERTLDAALRRPIWPWLTLAAQYDARIAAAVAAHRGAA